MDIWHCTPKYITRFTSGVLKLARLWGAGLEGLRLDSLGDSAQRELHSLLPLQVSKPRLFLCVGDFIKHYLSVLPVPQNPPQISRIRSCVFFPIWDFKPTPGGGAEFQSLPEDMTSLVAFQFALFLSGIMATRKNQTGETPFNDLTED